MERHICAGILHEPAHTNPEWFDSLQTSPNASKNDITTDRSLQGPVTMWLLNFLLNFLFAETSIPRRRYQDTIRMGKAGEELKNLVTRSFPLESLVALWEEGELILAWKFSLLFSLIQLTALGSPRMVLFTLPGTFFLYQLPMSPQRLSPVIDLTWLARMET